MYTRFKPFKDKYTGKERWRYLHEPGAAFAAGFGMVVIMHLITLFTGVLEDWFWGLPYYYRTLLPFIVGSCGYSIVYWLTCRYMKKNSDVKEN